MFNIIISNLTISDTSSTKTCNNTESPTQSMIEITHTDSQEFMLLHKPVSNCTDTVAYIHTSHRHRLATDTRLLLNLICNNRLLLIPRINFVVFMAHLKLSIHQQFAIIT